MKTTKTFCCFFYCILESTLIFEHFLKKKNFVKFLKKKKKKTLNLIAEVFQTLLTPKDVVIKLH